ncbi:MAG: GNAT family N-acetyltransferase [Anaerotignaceae bacterium]
MGEIITERLILRPIVINDLEDIFEYSKHPLVGPDAGWKPHESKSETMDIMKTIFIDKDSVWGIETKESKKIIGSVGLIEDPKRENKQAMMLGYAIAYEQWGKGITTEASRSVIDYGFKELGLSLISVCCYAYNGRSRGVIKKCGFKYEGTMRQAEERFDGKIFDSEIYSITKEEWECRK